MYLLHRMILKQLPGPFLGWLLLLMFLLLMQFLIKFLPELTGRDLPLGLILELIVYNLAYMVVLAIPMASLLATLMVFGTLAESRTWVVIRNCGITLWGLTWPVLAIAVLLSCCMVYFNSVLLPESNFRALNMWQSIRDTRPGFELEPGIFYQEIDEYSILVGQREGNLLYDILIYDYTQGIGNSATIRADRGELRPQGDFLELTLLQGEMHRLFRSPRQKTTEQYETLTFERLQLHLDLSELGVQMGTSRYRSDRSTPVHRMFEIVDSLKQRLSEQASELQNSLPLPMDFQLLELSKYSLMEDQGDSTGLLPDTTVRQSILDGLTLEQVRRIYQRAHSYGQDARSLANNKGRNLRHTTVAINRYQVEIHKKFSISIACFIFVLIGIPLGLSIRRGGLGIACLAAVGIFIFYWVTLVQGEKLADREFLSPWIGMWCANILIGATGVWLFIRVALDMRSRPRYTTKPESATP